MKKQGRFCDPAVTTCRRLALVLACSLFWLAPAAHGIEMAALYTVEVPYDSTDADAQADAYSTALIEVLIRVTGSTAVVASEEASRSFPNPAQFVMQYRPGQDGTLVVTLDGDAIERVLRQAGAPIWGADRPLTLIWLAVDWGLGEREIVGADDADRLPGDARSIDRNRLLRERVLDIARRRGIPVAFPLLDAEDLENVGFSDVWGGFDDRLKFASARYQATSVLIGRIRTDDPQPDRWTWYFGPADRLDWAGEPEDSIGVLADALAARFVIDSTQAVDTIHLTIAGIDSVDAYGRVQRFMENLRVLDELLITKVAGNTITYTVKVQGGTTRLENAIQSTGMLEPVKSSGVIDTTSYRLNGQPLGTDIGMRNEINTLEYLYRSQDN